MSAGLNPIINGSGSIPPAFLAGMETIVAASVAGALGFNVQGATMAAQNETLNNFCEHNSCGAFLTAFINGVSSAMNAGADVPAMESAAGSDVLAGIGNTALNAPTLSLPGMPDYVQYFQYSDSALGALGEFYGTFGLGALASLALAESVATNTADSAVNAVNGLNLNKSLASQQQLSQLISGNGINIAGNGTSVTLRDSARLVSEYGGQASDWSKVSSSSYIAADGSKIEIHAYRNAVTGRVVEPKSIVLK